jgi:hypothetical protein
MNCWSFLCDASAVGLMDMPAILVFTAPLSERLHHRSRLGRLFASSHQPTAVAHYCYIDPTICVRALFLSMTV